jgi:hypothetical protein
MSKTTDIERPDSNPGDFDTVVVGSPVWAFNVCPAVRTFLDRFSSSIEAPAYFCTMKGSGARQTLDEMESVAEAAPVATLALIDRHVRADAEEDYVSKVEDFVDRVLAPPREESPADAPD